MGLDVECLKSSTQDVLEKIKMTAAQAIGINRNNLDDAAFL